MQLIKGTAVKIYVRTQTGTDDFNRPIYTEQTETVDNVLIGSPTTEDIVNELDLSGKRISYILGIPEGDEHDWTDATVEFFGEKWRTFGEPMRGISGNIPAPWKMNVKVERI